MAIGRQNECGDRQTEDTKRDRGGGGRAQLGLGPEGGEELEQFARHLMHGIFGLIEVHGIVKNQPQVALDLRSRHVGAAQQLLLHR